jgi:response regulator of citrate/malate metabolism
MQAQSSQEWRVVVVEDDQAVASVHCRFVASQPGFQVVGRAETAAEAQRLIQTMQPDLLLLDLELSGPSGVALLRQLRASKFPTEVIVVTAHARGEVIRTCMQLGALDYLVKPFWLERLGEALDGFVSRMRTLPADRSLDQQEIDRARSGMDSALIGQTTNIRLDRLAAVRRVLQGGAPMTADEVAEATGMARVTARRYLEHLLSRRQCTVDAVAAGPGRPRKAYQMSLDSLVGSSQPRT